MPAPLDDYFAKARESIQSSPAKKTVEIDLNQFNKNAFRNAMNSIDTMDDHTLTLLIKNNLDTISKDIISGSTEFANLFMSNMKFISCFIRAVSSIPIDYTTKLACNKITYDYFTSDFAINEIKQMYLNMSKIVNSDMIAKLIAIGLDETTACNLALCRYSSGNEKTNVKRLNFAIYPRDPSMMTEQTIVWIYEKMFSRISDLFLATMFEVYSAQELSDFGDNFAENYGTVGLAILTILNNMTTENIRKVLIGYNSEWIYYGKPYTRFSLRSLSADYSRITRVVDYLTSTGEFQVF